jgi:hypothetical protein
MLKMDIWTPLWHYLCKSCSTELSVISVLLEAAMRQYYWVGLAAVLSFALGIVTFPMPGSSPAKPTALVASAPLSPETAQKLAASYNHTSSPEES